MIPIPAVDIRGGRCVQLVGGDPSVENVSRPDPVAEATRWVERGATWLHVVDLDAALDEGSNLPVIREILQAVPVPVQVGGGLRSMEDVQEVLDAGARRAVVGTRAVRDPEFLQEAGAVFGDALVVAVDARGQEIVVKGWTEGSGEDLLTFATRADEAGVGGLLYTDVGREGRKTGANVEGVRSLVDAVGVPVIASGGIANAQDLQALMDAGAWGAVVGMAFYDGTLDFQDALEVTQRG